MAAWLTVYCSHSVARLSADDLLTFLRDLEDPHTAAECYGLEDDEAVDRALPRLRVEPVSDSKGVKGDGPKFAVHYKAAGMRPVYLHLWANRRRVQTECEEALEVLGKAGGRNAKRVRDHLARAVQVVALELGWNQLEDVGIMFGGQLAEFVAVEGGGLIRDQNDDWWAMKNGRPVLLVGPRRRP